MRHRSLSFTRGSGYAPWFPVRRGRENDYEDSMKHLPGYTILASMALVFSLAASPAMARSSQDAKPAAQYPDATRKAPKLDLKSQKEQKALNEGLQAANSGDAAKAKELLQPIINDSDSKYAKALALQGLAGMEFNAGDHKKGIDMLKQSLALGVMPNDTYFQLEYELAQFQLVDGDYQAALDTLNKWRAEGKKETAESYALEGNAYYRMQQYPKAIAAIKKAESMTDKPKANWTQILMASYAESGQGDKAAAMVQGNVDINDPDSLNNAVAVMMQAGQNDQAMQLMEKARAQGALKSESTYVNLAKLHLIQAQSSNDTKPEAEKAIAILKEGMEKGLVTDTSDNQMLMGQAQEMAGMDAAAIATYDKALPDSKNGEPALRAGHLLLTQGKYTKARDMLQQAISKGVKHMGSAYELLAQSELALKHKSAAIAAMKKAAQQPETADKANAWLKKNGA